MKYSLDFLDTIDKTLLFWIERYIRNKITNLSNRNITNQEQLMILLQKLISGTKNIEELKILVKNVRNIGLSGVNTYFNPLYKLYNYITKLKYSSMKELDEEIMSDFLVTVTSGLSDASKKNHKIAVVNFFSYIDKQNISNENDMNENNAYLYNIELKNWGGLRGTSGNKLPSFMTNDEINRFIKAINVFKFSDKIRVRNKLIIKIILYTGIRVSEAINIKIKDIYQEKDVYIIQVRGKGNKPRVVMIKSIIIQKEFQEWLDIKNCNNQLIFCNLKGNLLTQSYISRVVEKILISAGIRKEKNGAHMLRHSFATLLYSKHHDLVLVQEALGHTDINTSRIYTHFDTSRLRKTIDLI
jgi:integrase/recombinase XerD